MHDEAHLRLLEHPVVAAYVSLRAFGTLAGQLDAMIAELRGRTRPGDHILCTGIARADQILALAGALPDRAIEVLDPCADRVTTTRDHIAGDGDNFENLSVAVGDLDAPQLTAGRFDAIVGMQSMHRVTELETYWAACRRALAPGGVVLAQEYVGPAMLKWPAAQRDAATHALETLVPIELKPHHNTIDTSLSAEFRAQNPRAAPRSEELLATCAANGFEIIGHAAAGCSLLIPVLIGQINCYDPRNWNHNHVLALLFAAEARLLDGETLAHDYAMFVARPQT